MSERLQKLYREALVWDAHAGVFPSSEVDLNLLEEWRSAGASYLSLNVGFDVMEWQDTLATLAAYRRWVLHNNDRFLLAIGDYRSTPESTFIISRNSAISRRKAAISRCRSASM
jgi:hypothetical protein